ncbi:MAG: hypothetical protein FWE87_06665, partial [Coriobacteriia bacterium]|nr:hypothetical protein [Coriobacteriia bacterium]
SAREAYNVTEMIDGVQSAEIYARLMGQDAGNAAIVYLGLPRILAANASGDFTVIPGLLGSAIEDAGGVTAALGNSDLGFTSNAIRQMRPAAVVAMNTDGKVALGTVSNDLLMLDFTAPYGLRTDREKLTAQMSSLAQELPVGKPSLVVIDPGDLYRAQASKSESSVVAAERNWNQALETLDEIYGAADDIYPDATIIIASQAALNPHLKREGLGPLIISQPQESAELNDGLLSSDSTQRIGLVTNLDLSATMYALLEIPAPLEVIGSPIFSRATTMDRVDYLVKSNNTALSVDSLRARVISTIIWITVLLLVAGAFVLVWADDHWKPETIKRVREVFNIAILGALSIPAATWFMFTIDRWPQTPNQVLAQLIAATVVLWIVAIIIWLVWGTTSGIIFLGAVTSLVIIVDQLIGAPLSFSGFLSYSPILAFRFYGLGNEGAALLYGATVMTFVLWVARTARPRRFSTWVLAAGAFFVMLVCAAPWWGANVGVAIWATVGYAVLLLLVNDQKITWKNILLMAIAVVLIIGVFIVIDRFGAHGETHLARAIGSAEQGGIAPLIEIVTRKIATNMRVLTASLWGVVFIAVIGFLLLMRFRPTPELTRTLEANRFFGDGMTALLVGGIVAFFTEDSGIVLPAIMVLYLGASLLWLMLDRLHGLGASPQVEVLVDE